MKAMVLAAGLGTRMRPLTLETPKPLIEVGGKALIDWSLEGLKDAGITDIVVNASYLGEQVATHIATKSDLSIRLSHEDAPLETGGGIKKALPFLGSDPFLVMNSDAFCLPAKEAIEELRNVHEQAGNAITLLVQPVEKAVGYNGRGDFALTDERKLRRRQPEDEQLPFVFTGMQMLDPSIFTGVAEEKFSMNLLYDASIDGNAVLQKVTACIHEGIWLHVGAPDEKAAAEAYLIDHPAGE